MNNALKYILGFLLLYFLLFGAGEVAYAQYPVYSDSSITEGVTYFDVGIGTYGFDVAATGQPAENWGGTLFLRGYPGPTGTLYTLDSRYIAGAELKYYGLLSDGFYAGPWIGGEISASFRPIVGTVAGYDIFSRFTDKSQYKNLHLGFDLQFGLDTEADFFIGAGLKIGYGYKNKQFKPDYR